MRIDNLSIVEIGKEPDFGNANKIRQANSITSSETRHLRKDFFNDLLKKKKRQKRDRYFKMVEEAQKRKREKELSFTKRFLAEDEKVKIPEKPKDIQYAQIDHRTRVAIKPGETPEQAIDRFCKKFNYKPIK